MWLATCESIIEIQNPHWLGDSTSTSTSISQVTEYLEIRSILTPSMPSPLVSLILHTQGYQLYVYVYTALLSHTKPLNMHIIIYIKSKASFRGAKRDYHILINQQSHCFQELELGLGNISILS